MAKSDGYLQQYIGNLTGGLETRLPANRLDPSMSPDLENVQLNTGAVSKRGGFVPFIKEQGALNSVRNEGFRRDVKIGTGAAKALNVPGLMLAGDRSHFNSLANGFTVECFIRIDNLDGYALRATATNPNASAGAYDEFNSLNDDVTLKIRPILSKGPVKKALPSAFGDVLATDTTDTSSFQMTTPGICQFNPTNRYGPDGEILDCSVPSYGSSTLTFVSAQPHGLTTADDVLVKGGGTSIDGVREVTVTNATTFTVTYGGTIASGPARVSVRKIPEVVGHGAPFVLYLWNENTNTSGAGTTSWKFRFSGHYRVSLTTDPLAGNYNLGTVQSTVTPRIGGVYHLIASFDYANQIMRFEVGEFSQEARGFVYTTSTTSIGSACSAPLNPPHPIQVFDCPQHFVENLSTGSPGIWDSSAFVSEPPGLGLHTNRTDGGGGGYLEGFGGYFNCVKRFEGAIDDIAIWSRVLGASDTSFRRSTKLTATQVAASTLVNYWPMTDGTDRVIKEGSGKDNHMYFCPDFPILDEESGGIESDKPGCWWFNGQTSYALADMEDTPNWSLLPEYDSNADIDNETLHPREAFIQRVVKNSSGFGLHVEFTADSIEPYEQVLAEISGVIRCVIRPDGRLGMYYRDGSKILTSDTGGDNVSDRMFITRYDGSLYSKTKVVPGRRYAASFVYNGRNTGTSFIAINRIIDTESASAYFGSVEPTSHPIGALTIGMGTKYNPNDTGRRGLTFTEFDAAPGEGDIGDLNLTTDKIGEALEVAEWASINPIISGYTFGEKGWLESPTRARHIDKGPRPSIGTTPLFRSTVFSSLDINPLFNEGNGDSPNRVATDFRTGFCGRIDEVRILVGEALNELKVTKDQVDIDYRYATQTLFEVPVRGVIDTDWTTSPTDDRQFGSEQRGSIEVTDPALQPVDVRPGQAIRIDPIAGTNGIPQVSANTANDITDVGAIDPPIPFGGAGGALEIARAQVRVYHVVARWVLNAGNEDEEIVAGRYRNAVEYRRPGVATEYTWNTTIDLDKGVCEQRTPVTDQVGLFGPLIARCIESDLLTEADQVLVGSTYRVTGNAAVRGSSYLPGRPFQELTPREVSPRWSEGLIKGALNDTRVSLIADWDHTRSGERFIITATGRNLYWAKKLWRDDSPFDDDTASIWFFGQLGEHVSATSSTIATQAFQSTGEIWGVQAIDIWLKPQRLDGRRVIVSRANLASQQFNYLVGTNNGSLFVCGSMDGGTKSWYYFEGDNRADTSGDLPNAIAEDELGFSRLRLNEWNHLHLLIYPDADTTGGDVIAWINGSPVVLTSLDGSATFNGLQFVTSTLGAALDVPDTSGQTLYIGGFPAGFQDVTLTTDEGASADTTWTFRTQAWHGLMTEFRAQAEVDPLHSGATTEVVEGIFVTGGAPVPTARSVTVEDATGFLMSLSEGEGWVFPNLAAPADSGISQIKELINIADNLGDSRRARYDYVVFRDNLYITNGAGRPLEVRYRRYSHPEGPFFVTPMGMRPPVPASTVTFEKLTSKVETTIQLATSALPSVQRVGLKNPVLDAGAVVTVPVATDAIAEQVTNLFGSSGGSAFYQVWMSFLDDLGRESDPAFLGDVETGSVGFATALGPEVTNTTAIGSLTGSEFYTVGGGGRDITFVFASTITADGLFGAGGFQDEPMLIEIQGTVGSGVTVTPGFYLGRYSRDGAYNFIYLPGTSNAAPVPSSSTANSSAIVRVWQSAFRVVGIPRSPEPHVVGRRFYVSAQGGGRPLLHSDVNDNSSEGVELIGPPATAIGIEEVGRKKVPPRAKFIASGAGFLVMANLTDAPAGRAAVALSDGAEVTYWPIFNEFILDSENGEAITGLGSHLERFYISKRNSIYRLQAGGQGSTARVEPVNESVGVGGALTKYDNLFFGAGERGIYRFDGSNVVYASAALEGDWSRVKVKDDDLIAQFGAFHRDESQFWISCRQPTAQTPNPTANNRIFVLHTAVGDRQAWTRWEVPPHTYMANVTDPLTQRPEVLLGGDDGRLLVYDREVFIDGSTDEAGPTQLAASLTQARLETLGPLTAGGLFTKSVLTTDAFDVVRDGLRGALVSVYYALDDNVSFGAVLTRVLSNTATTIQLENQSFPGNIALAYVAVGAYQSYWTTGWIGGKPSTFIKAQEIDLEFEPTACTATLGWVSAVSPATVSIPVSKPLRDWFSVDNRQSVNVSLVNGYQPKPQPVQTSNIGRYFRMFFGTPALPGTINGSLVSTGIRNPWTLQGIGVRLTDQDTAR